MFKVSCDSWLHEVTLVCFTNGGLHFSLPFNSNMSVQPRNVTKNKMTSKQFDLHDNKLMCTMH